MRHKLKQIVLAFYRSKVGFLIWSLLKKVANNRYIKKILVKLLDYSHLLSLSEDNVFLDQICFSANGKNILVLMPYWGVNATCMNVMHMCSALHRIGYTIHLIVYSQGSTAPSDSIWNYTYTLRPRPQGYSLAHPYGTKTSNLDANLIDDWVGEDLLSFIRQLDTNCHFELFLCNYIFFSKTLICFSDKTKKILVTHDVFSGRNKRLHDLGITSFFFGTVPGEEKKGVDRADYIIAVQKKEQLFFESLTDKPVITLPYVPPKKYLNLPYVGFPLRIGYIASRNSPNIIAIKELIRLLKRKKNIEIYIAGEISADVEQCPMNVHLLGIVDSLDEFYSGFDLYVNPDIMESGLKIKTVEAFSYGRPVVCTKEASIGIDVEKEYHQAGSIKEVVEMVEKCVNNPKLLAEMAEESKSVYDVFYAAYPIDDIIKKIVF